MGMCFSKGFARTLQYVHREIIFAVWGSKCPYGLHIPGNLFCFVGIFVISFSSWRGQVRKDRVMLVNHVFLIWIKALVVKVINCFLRRYSGRTPRL